MLRNSVANQNRTVDTESNKLTQPESKSFLQKIAEILWTFRFSLSSDQASRNLVESFPILTKSIAVSIGILSAVAHVQPDIDIGDVSAYEVIYTVNIAIYGFMGRVLHPAAGAKGLNEAVAYAEMLACWRLVSDLITLCLVQFQGFRYNLPWTALVSILITSVLILATLGIKDHGIRGSWWRSNVLLVSVNCFLSVMFLLVLPIYH